MAAGEGRRRAPASSTVVLRTLAEGLRVVTVLLWPYLPASAERLLAALGAPETLARRAPSSGAGAIERVQAIEPLFPKDAARPRAA